MDSVPPLPSRNGLNAFKPSGANTSMQPPQLPPRPSSQAPPSGSFHNNNFNQNARGYQSKKCYSKCNWLQWSIKDCFQIIQCQCMVEPLEVMGSMEDTIDKEHMVTPEAQPMGTTIIQDFKMLFEIFLFSFSGFYFPVTVLETST